MRNVLAHAGRQGRRVVSAFIATAFGQETPEAASTKWRAVVDQIWPKVPKLFAILDDAEPDVLAYMTFPKEHQARLLQWKLCCRSKFWTAIMPVRAAVVRIRETMRPESKT